MKDLIDLLVAYPTWVKITIAILLAVCFLLLILFKPTTASAHNDTETPKVTIDMGSNQGNIAGRDVVIHNAPTGAQTGELISVLAIRAKRINEQLTSHFKHAPVNEYLEKFNALHERHVAALSRDNLIEAHEILLEIHELSRSLQGREFNSRHRAETPDIRYSMRIDAFLRGPLIEIYAGPKLTETLVSEHLRADIPRFADTKVDASTIYCQLAIPSDDVSTSVG